MPRNSVRFLLLLVAFVLLIPGCRRGGGPAPATQPPATPLAPTALLYYDNSGGIQDPLRLVIRDGEQFRQIWRRATSTQGSPPPLPALDFDRVMVLVVSAGRMTPEDAIRVDSVGVHEEVGPNGDRDRVMQAIIRTIRGCSGFEADAYPLAIVQVQRFEGPVRFTERREQAPGCTASEPGSHLHLAVLQDPS